MTTNILQTPYGVFGGVISKELFPDGTLQGIRLEEKNMLLTHAGELVPFYGEDSLRRKNKPSVTFHKNGMVKAVELEEQQEVITPIGELPAELISFYETGEVSRVFPVDGQISGFWSEEDERAMNVPLSFDLGFTSFSALLSGIGFYKNGQIRSVTLFPNERIEAACPDGSRLQVRQGFSLYEDGTLESLEPAVPTAVRTPVGTLTAYDVNAHGINADSNSLRFDKAGRIERLVTSGDRIYAVRKSDGGSATFQPVEVEADDGEGIAMLLTVEVAFDHDAGAVSITGGDGGQEKFAFDDDFIINRRADFKGGCSPADCASCKLCSSKEDCKKD